MSSPDPAYDRVRLVYNPGSSGGAPDRAREFATALAHRAPDLPVECTPTEYAGHARVLARETRPGTLLVSVSGDGGYNEVVRGVMESGDGRSSLPVAVLPAGNANDHHRTTSLHPLVDAVARGTVVPLDVLRVAVGDDAPMWAHSYVGLGITPVVALEIEKGRKGSVREVVTTVRGFARFRPFSVITDDGERLVFDSLVLANIPEMAKYATLAEDADPADGRFEVVTIPHTSRPRLLAVAVRAALRGLGPQPSVSRYDFTTTTPLPMQIDGEVHEIGAHTRVGVAIAPRALTAVR